MTRKRLFAIAAVMAVCPLAAALVPPPYYSAVGTAYTPEIGVVNTGVLQDVQAAASADQRYVTLTMGVSNSNLLALREFSFDGGTPTAGNPPGPVAVTFLDRPGITRVDVP
jgi:hypothetical protein